MKTTLLLFSILAVSFANLVDLDAILIGSLGDISDKSFPVLSLAANLTVKPANVSSSDVNNENNSLLKALNTTQLVDKLNAEIALRLKELEADNNFLNLKAGFEQLRDKLDSIINLVLNGNDCYDPTVIDFSQVARHHLRALLSRYKARKLAKYLQWYTHTNDFRIKRLSIRDLRVQILSNLKNASELVDSTVSGGCAGLNLLGGLCLRSTILNLINLVPAANNLLNSILNIQTNLSNLATTYNNDLTLIQDFFTNNDLLDNDDNLDYQNILDALERKRNFLLANWVEIVSKLQELLNEDNLVTLKGRVRKLFVGWKFGNDDNMLTLNKLTNIDSLNNVISLEFVGNLVKDTACGCAVGETVEEAAIKLQSAIKTVLQTSCLLDRINVEDVIVDTAANIARVVVHIREYEIENNRLVNDILLKANINLPDLSTYQSDLDAFIANLTEPDNHINDVLQHFNNLRDQIKNDNNALNDTIVDLIIKKDNLDFSALHELSNFTANITTLVQFSQNLVNRYVQSANATFDGQKFSSDCIGVSVKEALAKIEILKHHTLIAAVQLKNATEDKVKNALNETIENLKAQILETLKDREVKKQCHDESNEVSNEGYNGAQTQHQNLLDNLQSLITNKRRKLQEIKEKINQNYQNFEDSIKIAVRAYRPSLLNIIIVAGADLNNNDDSLTVNVSIEDVGSSGESDDERRKAHTCILKAIFAVLTTDVDVSVTASLDIKRANNDVYNVRSSTPTTPTSPTPVPVGSPTPVPVGPPTPVPVANPTPVPVANPTPDNPLPTSGAVPISMYYFVIFFVLVVLI